MLWLLHHQNIKIAPMNVWIMSIQPPGLMKMRLLHHQEHHLGDQAPQNKPLM